MSLDPTDLKAQNQLPEILSADANTLAFNGQENDTGNQKKIKAKNCPFNVRTGYFDYVFSSDTTQSDPTDGVIKFNTNDQGAITEVYISTTDKLGAEWINDNIIIGTRVKVLEDENRGVDLEVSGEVTVGGLGWRIVPVLASGNFGVINNGATVQIEGIKESLITASGIETLRAENAVFIYSDITLSPPARYCLVDPSSGDIDITLPTGTDQEGRRYFIKRVANGGNVVSVVTSGGDLIDGYDYPFKLADKNEFVEVQYEQGTWYVLNRRTFCFASMEVQTPTTFALTTDYTVFDSWDTITSQTSQRLLSNDTTGAIEVVSHSGSPVEGYKISCIINIENSTNKYVMAQLFFNGNPVNAPVAVNGLGSGKPTTIVIGTIIPVDGVGDIDVRIKGETDNLSMGVLSSSIVASRIGG